MLPKVSSNYFQERQGVLKVAELLNAAGLVFRETPNADVGIDGHVELVNDDGQATGANIAVQIKSGESYLKEMGNSWAFYPSTKHIHYWEMYPLPVILLLHDPATGTIYWDDIRLKLRSDQEQKAPILIPKDRKLLPANALDLFSSCGSTGRGLLSEIEVLAILATTRCPNASFPLSFLELFLEGLTDIGRKLFFSAGMAWELAAILIPEDSVAGIGMGNLEHMFLEKYLRFLVEQSLVHIDFSDVLVDIVHRGLHPTIVAPLTARGRIVRDLCREIAASVPERAITEASLGFLASPTNTLRSIANAQVAKNLELRFSASSQPSVQ
jgi:hypothetical protein